MFHELQNRNTQTCLVSTEPAAHESIRKRDVCSENVVTYYNQDNLVYEDLDAERRRCESSSQDRRCGAGG